MTEREERELERLKYVDDYYEELAKTEDLFGRVPDAQVEKIVKLITKSLYKKYKYLIKISAKYRKPQSFLSALKDDKEIKKNNEEEVKEKILTLTGEVQEQLPGPQDNH